MSEARPPTTERVLALLRAESRPMRATTIAQRMAADKSTVWASLGALLALREVERVGGARWAVAHRCEISPTMARALERIRQPGDHTADSIAESLGCARRHALVTLRALANRGLVACEVDPNDWRTRHWREVATRRRVLNKYMRIPSIKERILAAIQAEPDGLTVAEVSERANTNPGTAQCAVRKLQIEGSVDVDNEKLRGRAFVWRATGVSR